VLVLLALLGLVGWWWSQEEAVARPRHETVATASAPAEHDAQVAVPPPSSSSSSSVSSSSTGRVVTPHGPVDPCGDGADDPPVTRPSLDDLLQLRIAELNDRMRATLSSPTASPALRHGWEAALDPARGDEALRLLLGAPDRVDEGFDTYVAVSMVLAARALGSDDDPVRAIRIADNASRAAPDDALPCVIGAIAHERHGDHGEARRSIARAFAIDPEDPAIAYSLAWRLENDADIAGALRAFDAYLASVPDDLDMQRRRARLAIRAASFTSAITYTRGGITLIAPSSLSRQNATHVLDVVDAGIRRGASLLGVPVRGELAIFVHADREAMHRATCVQGWAGAVFDGALETDVETLSSPAGDRSLVHESFHAAIHPAVPNVPTWLDEGLAQYASGEEGPPHVRSYELMLREHTWIPFASMNDAFLAIDDSTDAGLAYHQALAMVEWLVERRGERGIRDAAAWLVAHGDPSRVLAEAAHGEIDGDQLLAFIQRHLAALRAQGHAPPP